jgi:hypothetical protein
VATNLEFDEYTMIGRHTYGTVRPRSAVRSSEPANYFPCRSCAIAIIMTLLLEIPQNSHEFALSFRTPKFFLSPPSHRSTSFPAEQADEDDEISVASACSFVCIEHVLVLSCEVKLHQELADCAKRRP